MRWFNGFVDNHPSNGTAILLLFRRIHAVGRGIHSQAVDHLLDREILKLSIVVCVLCLKDRDEATGTGGVDSSQARIEFHDIGPGGQREMCNRLVGIQSKNRKGLGSVAQKKRPMVL